jgi:aspartate 1-decarboxylase
MQIHLLKSKIHRAQITGGNLDYQGSLTIAEDLMEKVDLRAFERILCSNLASGQRFETYAIPGPQGSGAIVLNGAAAHCGTKGDLLTIMCFAAIDAQEAANWHPKVIVLGPNNTIIDEHGI